MNARARAEFSVATPALGLEVAIRGFAAIKKNIVTVAKIVLDLTSHDASRESELRKLYRLSLARDTVTPEVLEALRKN